MSYLILTNHLDLIGFALVGFFAMLLVDRWIRRSTGGKGFSTLAWGVLLAIMAVGSGLAIIEGHRESDRQRDIVAGFAPTYAAELFRMGHGKITAQTPADDPTYLALIDTQLRWLRLNQAVADIYTFGKNSEGQTVLLVDSETDYDRNGVIEGDAEQRTTIGEVYEEDVEVLTRAFSGEEVFTSDPTTDRWGTWMSTYIPMRDEAGQVTGVLGVDFPAAQWIASILWSRAATLGFTTVVCAIFTGAVALTTAMRAEVAKRRQTESALRASEGRLRTIVDNEPECVMVVDRNGTLLEINPSGLAMAQATAAEVIGKSFYDLVRPQHRQRVREHQQQVADGDGGIVEFEFVGLRGACRPVWMETHSVPLRDEAGKVVSILSVARDVAARKQAEEEREQLQRQLVDASRVAGMAEIATGVLHNVGNVLTSVNVSANLLAERLEAADTSGLTKAAQLVSEHREDLHRYINDDEVGKQIPQFITIAAQCLDESHREMVNELTQLSRGIEHIKEIVRSQQSHAKGTSVALPMRPVEVMEQAVQVDLASLERYHIELVRRFEDLPLMHLDKHRILQILVNLITNARQAIAERDGVQPGGGSRTITLSLRYDERKGRLRFEVEDSGMGIAPENLNRIFRHGFTTREDGHGFGLHSAANAATEMNGTLTAHSEGMGLGAKFTLEIPAKIQHVDSVGAGSGSVDGGQIASGEKVR